MADVLLRKPGSSVRIPARLRAALYGALLFTAACATSPDGAPDDSPPPEPRRLTLVTSSPLATTNAAGLLGASTSADTLAGRLYPPAFVHGPSGQQIPNRDLVTAQPLPGPEPRVVYTINPEATYSDGAPVTCTDFLLSYKAGTLPGLFDAFLPRLRLAMIDMLKIRPIASEPGDHALHQQLADAIVARDPDAAAASSRTHLSALKESFS